MAQGKPARGSTPQGLQRALEALQRPLRLAARNGFSELDRIPNLGRGLQRACAVVLARGAGQLPAEWERFSAELEQFDGRPRVQRARLVAQGLRLCAQSVTAEPAAPARRRAGGMGGTARDGERSPSRPAAAASELDRPLTVLKGVGAKVAARLAARGLETVEDLLNFLPLEYVDQRRHVALDQLEPGGTVTTSGTVLAVRSRGARRRRVLEVVLGREAGDRAHLTGVWFRAYPGLEQRFEVDRSVTLFGEVKRYQGGLQMVHPDLIEAGTASVRRRYPEVQGVAPRLIERLCDEACERFASLLEDAVPQPVARELGLPSQQQALLQLHLRGALPGEAEVAQLNQGSHPAHQRLVFDELFALQLESALQRARWGERRAHRCTLGAAAQERFRSQLPFELTGAQERVVAELLDDMAQPRPMHRLLQGDVGSGKTVVAFVAVLAALESRLQAAVMAPTEILARQHFATMEPWARAMGRRAALITASTPRGVKESMLALADGGRIHLLVGTHALLSPRVSLPDLGLAVVDEQHRFGVLQRMRLRERPGDQPLPHLLLMTATPIPRSLALAVYGDMELSLLDEKPPGRRPAQTRVYVAADRERAYARVAQQLELGHQVFVVCPLVEESDKLAVADAVGTADRLRRRFGQYGVGLVHGRLGAQERDAVMQSFRRRELNLLVATTVIEVGIDIPHASTMVVEHAERFGLAQLHQLRGRVGRGDQQALCLLLADAPRGSDAASRLQVMARTDDGFEIAEADLRIRGPGELHGTRQAGLPRFRFADLRRHMELLALARRHADQVVAWDPELARPEHRAAGQALRRRALQAQGARRITPD